MKKIFSLFTAILFAGSMFATEVAITFSEEGLENGVQYKSFTVDEAISLAFGDGGNDGKYYNTGAAIRVYGGGHLTVASESGAISKIVLTFGSGDGTNEITANVGEYEDGTWTGSATEVTLTVGGTSGHRRIASVTVTYAGGAAPAVSKPAILGKAKFVGETEVTFSCETEGAKIYYTLDGEDPDAEATEYLGLAVKLTETTTVKAIAIKGEDKSSIAEKAFTYYEASTCAEAAALAKDAVTGLNEVTVTYVNGGNTYVKDATGYELIYAFDFGLVAGDVVNGFIGKSSPYNGLPELKPEGVALADLDVVHGEAPAPEEIKAAPTADDINKYLIIKGVSVEGVFTTEAATNLDATIGEETFVLRNNFKIAQTFEKDKKYDIVGAGAIYTKNDNTTLQLYFISATESSTTALDNNAVETKAVKAIVNGQLLITRDGKTFNVLGTVVK